jgi:hypothetical protein
MLLLPEELQVCCTNFLDAPSAGRLTQASRACARAVHERLITLKLEYAAAQAAAAAAEAAAAEAVQPAPAVFTAMGKVFIAAYLDVYMTSDFASRQVLIKRIKQAATGREDLGSNWTTKSVSDRLKRLARAAR